MNIHPAIRRMLGLPKYPGPTRAQLTEGQNALWRSIHARDDKAAALAESLVTAFENAETLREIAQRRIAKLEATIENLTCGESIAERIVNAINTDEIAALVAENHAADIASEIDITDDVENALDALGIVAPDDRDDDDDDDCPNTQGIDDVCAIVISQGQEITVLKKLVAAQAASIATLNSAAGAFAAVIRPTMAEQVTHARTVEW